MNRIRFLKFASFIVAAMFFIALVATFSSVIPATHPVTVFAVRLLLRFATLSSFITFYVVFEPGLKRGSRLFTDAIRKPDTRQNTD